MAKVVFAWKETSRYDDEPGVRYNFPRQYRARVEQALGDWSVWHELHDRGRGRAAYVSLARIVDMQRVPTDPDLFNAVLAEAVDLPRPVPVIGASGPIEERLAALPGSARRPGIRDAVRLISDQEFRLILAAAGVPADLFTATGPGLHEDQEAYGERDRVTRSASVRDDMFRRRVLDAYGSRCAVTGLRLVNGGGAVEVDAAHIRPVKDGGPDKVRNGIALTKTVHWMFDRHLITFDDDLGLVRTAMLDADARRFLGNTSQLRPPEHDLDRPSPVFLAWHRERTLLKERLHLGR